MTPERFVVEAAAAPGPYVWAADGPYPAIDDPDTVDLGGGDGALGVHTFLIIIFFGPRAGENARRFNQHYSHMTRYGGMYPRPTRDKVDDWVASGGAAPRAARGAGEEPCIWRFGDLSVAPVSHDTLDHVDLGGGNGAHGIGGDFVQSYGDDDKCLFYGPRAAENARRFHKYATARAEDWAIPPEADEEAIQAWMDDPTTGYLSYSKILREWVASGGADTRPGRR